MNGTKTFIHSGDMGDIVASLPTVKAICKKDGVKARYILDATGGMYDESVKMQTMGRGNKFDLNAAKFLKPLLEAQKEYISEVVIDTMGVYSVGNCKDEVDYNLNIFRKEFANPKTVQQTNQNLMFLHQSAFGLPIGYDGDWLDVQIDKDPEGTLFARSNRYQSGHLVWEMFIAKLNASQTPYDFVGTDLEEKCFKDCFRFANPHRIIVKDALELAKVIGEHKEIVANGTLALWLAIGMGHQSIFHEVGLQIPTTVFPTGLDKKVPNIKYFQGGSFLKV